MKYYKQDMPNHKTGYVKINDATKELWHIQVNDETGTEFFRKGTYDVIMDKNNKAVYHIKYMEHDGQFPYIQTYFILLYQWNKSDELTFARAAGAL